MPTSEEVRKSITRPQLTRLKQLGKGIRVDRVMGHRVLVRTIIPYTQLDEVEKKGLLYIPEDAKEKNTPLPSTGLVVQVGEGASTEEFELLTGAMVYFSKFAGSDLVVSEEDYKIMDIDEIMCTFVECADGEDAPIAEVAS